MRMIERLIVDHFMQTRVWEQMDGDYSVSSFLNALGLKPAEVDTAEAQLQDGGVQDLEALLTLPSQQQRVRE